MGFAVDFLTAKLPVIQASFVMQNIVNQRKRNRFDFVYLYLVTYPIPVTTRLTIW